MATLASGSQIVPNKADFAKLAFPPPEGAAFVVCVHRGALKAPDNGLTMVLALADHTIAWVGAVDERMVESNGETVSPNPRRLLSERMLVGDQLWRVVTPGDLVTDEANSPLYTVYDGARPWVVVGQLESGRILAAPLNDARGNPKWWAPQLQASDLDFPGSKLSQLELAHLWSLPPDLVPLGAVTTEGADLLCTAIRSYFDG